ncbi:Ig-like domain-containing protein [Tetragenococcus halophilus]|uniref:Ig domain-containing protein n=1 Tax=Tetragenococcus halophilus TaxID=51669 RepID=A0AB35HLX6_TETHA|nr:Ig-like domain-containing protein [Tetragenococcus halophilus]MCO8297263.1 Ig domain-containing protein [Tetragenococcus halophilus]
MADVLKVYKNDEVVSQAERGEDGKATATVNNLEPNKNYEAGDYKLAWENENGESDKVDVPEFKTKPIAVTGVSLDKETLTMDIGDSETIKATVAPSTATDKGVSYGSSNRDIATVDSNGKVTAVASGTANIEATTNDGNKKATCKVTVAEPGNVEVDPNEEDADVSAE